MDTATYDDFAKLDIRVAKIIEVERIPGKSKIIKGTIDLGEEKRQVIIGGAEYYQPEELVKQKSHSNIEFGTTKNCRRRV